MSFRIFLCVFVFAAFPVFAQTAVPSATPQAMQITPQMQQQYLTKLQNMWQQMPADKKQQLEQQVMTQYQSLTPQQKQSIQDQAMQKYQSMTPQQKAQMTSQFQSVLQSGALNNAMK
jgi:hypothetical protein